MFAKKVQFSENCWTIHGILKHILMKTYYYINIIILYILLYQCDTMYELFVLLFCYFFIETNNMDFSFN